MSKRAGRQAPGLACAVAAIPTPFTPGSTITSTKDSPACEPTSTAATAGGAFSQDRELKQQLVSALLVVVTVAAVVAAERGRTSVLHILLPVRSSV